MATIQFRDITGEEDGMRLDRWFKEHYPGLSFGQLQKLLRTGQVRIDGKRAKTNSRVIKGQQVRIPPLATDEKSQNAAPKRAMPRMDDDDADFLRSILLYEDKDIYVFNKPAGLAVQAGSGLTRHMDGMLEALTDKHGQKTASCASSGSGYVWCACGGSQTLYCDSVDQSLSRAFDAKDLLGFGAGCSKTKAGACFRPIWPNIRRKMATGCGLLAMVIMVPSMR